MKEMLKNKIVIAFIVFVLGITYMNSIQLKEMETKPVAREMVLDQR